MVKNKKVNKTSPWLVRDPFMLYSLLLMQIVAETVYNICNINKAKYSYLRLWFPVLRLNTIGGYGSAPGRSNKVGSMTPW